MKTSLTVLPLLFIYCIATGQTAKPKISIELSGGLVNSYMIHSPGSFFYCIDGCQLEEELPRPGLRIEGTLVSEWKSRHGLAVSFLYNEHRYWQKGTWAGDIVPGRIPFEGVAILSWLSLAASHRFNWIKGEDASVFLSNGIQADYSLDYYEDSGWRPVSFSYAGKIAVEYRLTRKNSITVSPLFRMALGRYNRKEADAPAYRPYGIGLMAGLRRNLYK